MSAPGDPFQDFSGRGLGNEAYLGSRSGGVHSFGSNVVDVDVPPGLHGRSLEDHWRHDRLRPVASLTAKTLGFCVAFPLNVAALFLPHALLLLIGFYLHQARGGEGTAGGWLSALAEDPQGLPSLAFLSAMLAIGALFSNGSVFFRSGFETRREFLYEIFRLPLKDAIGMVVAIPLGLLLVAQGIVDDWAAGFPALFAFLIVRKTASLLLRPKIDRWLHGRHEAVPARDPLLPDPAVHRSPPA